MTTEMITDGMYVVAEYTGTQNTYYYRGMNLIGYVANDEIGYYRFNAHGDVVAVVDTAGEIITEYSYDPFGKLEDDENEWLKILFGIYVEDNNPFRYCAEYYDSETEFIYLRARYYSPDLQRFISEDPIRDGNNWYAYCANMPINYIDFTGYWQEGDEKFCTTMQIELLKLTYAWYLADSEEEKNDIHERADALRDFFSKGLGKVVDVGKTITGAAADEFAWWLGGDVDRAERDYWLTQVNQFYELEISEKESLRAIMFIASIGMPSLDDAFKYVSQKASKEMLEKVGEKGVKKFLKAITKKAAKKGSNGVKKLAGKGIKGFMYEAKVVGKEGAYRLLGNIDDTGNIIWEVFEKVHK